MQSLWTLAPAVKNVSRLTRSLRFLSKIYRQLSAASKPQTFAYVLGRCLTYSPQVFFGCVWSVTHRFSLQAVLLTWHTKWRTLKAPRTAPCSSYRHSRGALILSLHPEKFLLRFFFPASLPLLRPPSCVASQSSSPPCTSHWVLLASGQDCPPFLCALPLLQHTPPIQPYKGHMISLLKTMTPHPPSQYFIFKGS